MSVNSRYPVDRYKIWKLQNSIYNIRWKQTLELKTLFSRIVASGMLRALKAQQIQNSTYSDMRAQSLNSLITEVVHCLVTANKHVFTESKQATTVVATPASSELLESVFYYGSVPRFYSYSVMGWRHVLHARQSLPGNDAIRKYCWDPLPDNY